MTKGGVRGWMRGMPLRAIARAVALGAMGFVVASCAPAEPVHTGRPGPSTARAAPAAIREIWRPMPPATANIPELLPAGLCGFDNYLHEACGDAPPPGYAGVLGVSDSVAEIEGTLREARMLELAAGYPFAVSLHDLPPADGRTGLAVVAGLFATRPPAEAYARDLPSSAQLLELAALVELAPGLFQPKSASAGDAKNTAVELAEDTPAWSTPDLERVEHELDEALARRWVKLPKQRASREAALAKLAPKCRLERGRVFAATEDKLYAFRRNYAPVDCPDGTRAWVPWRATRLESVVERAGSAAKVHQVVLVECDQATVETRAFSSPSSGKALRLALGGPC